MRHLTAFALLVAGIVHLLPLPGVLGAPALQRLYGLAVTGPDLAILLQHRAVLFGVLGVFMLVAVVQPSLRVPASWVGLASAAAFVAVAWQIGGYNDAIRRVVIADVVVCVLLVAGLVAEWATRPGRAA
jgi:hypothetical protein